VTLVDLKRKKKNKKGKNARKKSRKKVVAVPKGEDEAWLRMRM